VSGVSYSTLLVSEHSHWSRVASHDSTAETGLILGRDDTDWEVRGEIGTDWEDIGTDLGDIGTDWRHIGTDLGDIGTDWGDIGTDWGSIGTRSVWD